MNTNYSELISSLRHIVLEESWVIKIEQSPGQLRLTFDAVLTPEHLEYAAPKPDEIECYRPAILSFDEITDLQWLGKDKLRPAIDANKESDRGHIDVFGIKEHGYYLAGDFGTLEITTQNMPRLILK